MSGRLEELAAEFSMVERALGDPAMLAEPREYARLTRRHRELTPLVTLLRERDSLTTDLAGARELLADPDMRELAAGEVESLTARLAGIETDLEVLLLPTDPDDGKNVILELRAGAGGAEAGLFATDLLRMYTRYAEGANLKLNVLDASESDLGGASKVVAEITGDFAYRAFKWNGASTAFSACLPPNRRAGFIPVPSRWPCCPKCSRMRCISISRKCELMCTALRAQAGRA